MADGRHPASVVRFGTFELDLEARELRKRGRKVALQDQPLHVLCMLLEQPGQVVSRDALQKRLWTSDTFVDFDRGLNKAINRIRQTLGDLAASPRFVETLPRRGYRFIASIEYSMADAGVARDFSSASHDPCVPQSLVRASLLPPVNTSFLPYHFALSPDATRLAFVAADSDGTDRLWVRALSASEAQPLNGTERARLPFWSPDSAQVGFFAAGKLKTVDIAGGAVSVLCDSRVGRGGAWNADGVIVFAPDVSGPLCRVSARGGIPEPVTRIREEHSPQSHCWPVFVGNGERFLYFVNRSMSADPLCDGIHVGSLDSKDTKLVSADLHGNVGCACGCLLFVSGGALVAQPFDAESFQLTGPPVPIAQHELEPTERVFIHSGFSASQTGIVVFQSSNDFASQLLWTDSSGREAGVLPPRSYRDPSISPDGRLLAVSSDEFRNGKQYICICDLERGVTRRLTDGGIEVQPAWSADGTKIAYVSAGNNAWCTYEIAVDGSSPPQLLCEMGGCPNWSPDGHVALLRFDGTRVVLAVRSPSGHEIIPFGPGAEPQFSPDGKWLAAVQQDGAGILVRSFPGPGPHIQISTEGGAQPRWSRDGTRIFYVARDRKMMAVSFDPAKGASSAPHALFQTRIIAQALIGFQYDVAPDGRFLINSLPPSFCPLTLLTGWATLLKR